MKIGQRKRQRLKRRRSRETGDAARYATGVGGSLRERWANPTRGQLRSLAAAIRRRWVSLDELDAFMPGVLTALESVKLRQCIAAVYVVIAAESVALDELEREIARYT